MELNTPSEAKREQVSWVGEHDSSFAPVPVGNQDEEATHHGIGTPLKSTAIAPVPLISTAMATQDLGGGSPQGDTKRGRRPEVGPL